MKTIANQIQTGLNPKLLRDAMNTVLKLKCKDKKVVCVRDPDIIKCNDISYFQSNVHTDIHQRKDVDWNGPRTRYTKSL